MMHPGSPETPDGGANAGKRILIVEDLPSDAELCEREVAKTLIRSEFRRVETREDFLEALRSFVPDLIVSDYKLPQFDGIAALGIARELAPETPFIVLTGSMNEDTAVDCMKAGAWDYVIKEHIRRLGTAILGALEEQHLRLERRRAEAERERLLRQLTLINRLMMTTLGSVSDPPAVFRALYEQVRQSLDALAFIISRYDPSTNGITALYVVDQDIERDVSTFPVVPLAPEGGGMQSQVLRSRQPLRVAHWRGAEEKMRTIYMIGEDGTLKAPPPQDARQHCANSALLVPLILHGKSIGVLQVQSEREDAYTEDDVAFLSGVANVAAISIHNALLIAEAEQASRELRRSLEGTLLALSRTTETRDPYTAGHQHRVTNLALAIAHELACSEEECDTLRIAGMIHDIGKMGVPAEVLSKPAVLSSLELALVRTHPQAAYDILVDVPFPGPVAEIVLQHHERMDGSGYPRGLAGDAILPAARILAAADVVEAMASHRPYRAALGLDVALEEIQHNAGRLYDQSVVDACLRLFHEGRFAFSTP